MSAAILTMLTVSAGQAVEQPVDDRVGPVLLPVARVAVDVSLSHLDRPFDYRVPAGLDAEVVPGCRVRVRFAGRLRDGFVLARVEASEQPDRQLAEIHKVVSSEPVLTPEVARLIRAAADHYAGCFADVMRLALPPRHAATEKAAAAKARQPNPGHVRARVAPESAYVDPGSGPFGHYPSGPELLASLARGDRPRAAWQLLCADGNAGDWAAGFAVAAAATLRSGRGSLLIVPDQRDLERLAAACETVFGRSGFTQLSADLGPAARYRAFLAAVHGDVSVVIGTRAASFAPVRDLGLIALWDDGDDLLAEPRAPYPHAREVLALRAVEQHTAVLMAGYARSCEVQRLVEQGWLRELAAGRTEARASAPRIRIAADSDHALARDPAARASRLPHEVFEVIRAGLSQGPVLIQVPRSGYLLSLACQDCWTPVRCPHCQGPVRADRSSGDRVMDDSANAEPASAGRRPRAGPWLSCRWCSRLLTDWQCPECASARWRAPVVGSIRTAEELGRAFPNVPVKQSAGGRAIEDLADAPALVVATPGAEPCAPTGYAAAVLLDAQLSLLRSDLRAAEEALRRWLNAVALVRPGAEGGTVIAVGQADSRALQALIRLDPAGFASRELVDRVEARFPPAVKLIAIDGRRENLSEVAEAAQVPDPTDVLGPAELGPNAGGDVVLYRLTLRTPLSHGAELTAAIKAVAATRSAKKADGALRIQVDPVSIG